MKKALSIALATVVAVGMCLPYTATAAELAYDKPKGYATELPDKSDPGVLVYEDFNSAKVGSDGSINGWIGTGNDNQDLAVAKLEVVSGGRSGKCLKVYDRNLSKSTGKELTSADDTGIGYNTAAIGGLGDLITQMFVKDSSNSKKTDTYFFSCWVKNVDPGVKQKFFFMMQYGGSGEVYMTQDNSFVEVTDQWTQYGVLVKNGKTYYSPIVNGKGAAVYPPRRTTSGVTFKGISRNEDGSVQTSNAYLIDDVVIWKVDDASKLVADPNNDTSGNNTTTQKPDTPVNTTTSATTTKNEDNTPTTSATKDNTTGTDTTDTNTSDTNTTDTDTTGSDITGIATATADTESTGTRTQAAGETTTPSDEQTGTEPGGSGLSAGAIAGIVIACIVVLGGGGFCLYWFVIRKKMNSEA